MPLPRRGRVRAGAPAANPLPARRRGRGSSADALPTRRRRRRSPADPTPTRCRARALDDSLLPGLPSAVHSDVQVASGGELIPVDCHWERTVRGRHGPMIVALGSDGMYSTESVGGRFDSIDMDAFGASWSPPCAVCTRSEEEEEHVGSSASAQTPHPDRLQHQAFSDPMCKEEQVSEPASPQTQHKLDVLPLKDPRYTMTMEGSSATAASLPSRHGTIEASPPSGRSLSSSPIWIRRDFEWGISFYTIKDLGGYFHTFPDVGGPFHSNDQVNKAIHLYLTAHEAPRMDVNLSEVDKLIQDCRYYPDGTKRRLKAGQPIDKMRDANYQLVQAVVHKYNDHHNLSGDHAYEVKHVLDEPSLWEEENYRMYMHMNFTAKTKGSDGFDAGSDKLFFAEVTFVGGDDELTLNCCCAVNTFDNGPCFGCGITMKHPNDGNAYNGGRMNATYSLPFGNGPLIDSYCYDEDSDEEVERLRFLFGGARATAGVLLEA